MTTTKLFANKIVGTETTVKSGVSGERLRSNKFNFLFFSLIVAVALSVSFASCSKDDDDNETALTATTEPGVVINGVKWATRNVDSVGYFADSPESFGRYYQWNRKKAWTAGSTDGMDNSDPTGTTWETENDPSPAGWRVPTISEIRTLFDTEKVSFTRTTRNDINGILFTDKASSKSIFLPAAGRITLINGSFSSDGTYYWSSTPSGQREAFYLKAASYSNGENENTGDTNRTYGFSIRPVAAE